MSEAAEGAGDAPTVIVTQPSPEPEKKKRQARPYWLLIPSRTAVEGGQTFEVHVVVGKREVLKLLKKLEIDATDPRVAGMKLLRADQVPIKLESQTIFKFGKAAGEAEDDEDDEVI